MVEHPAAADAPMELADAGRHTEKHRSRTGVGLVAVAGAAALWAVAATTASALFDAGVAPDELAAARAVIALAGFAIFPAAWRRPAGSRRASLVVLGAAIALVNATYYLAIDRIPVAIALVLQYTAPVLIVAWTALVAGRRPSASVITALLAAFAGVVLVLEVLGGDFGELDGFGVSMGLASALLFATYTLLSESVAAIYGATGAMVRGFAVASLVWLAYHAPSGFPAELVEPANLPGVLYVGIAGTLAPFFLFVWGVQRVRSERAAIAATLEPVIAAVVAWVWLGQRLSSIQMIGGLLVIAAVISLQLERRRPLVAPEP